MILSPLRFVSLLLDRRNAGQEEVLQRLYSKYPRGWQGSVLLLLRAAVGVTLIFQGSAYIPELQHLSIGAWMIGLLTVSSGTALLVGLLTRVFGGLAVALCITLNLSSMPAPHCNFFFSNPLGFDVIVMAMVSTMLGPGALSLDARFFGRRKIVIAQLPH